MPPIDLICRYCEARLVDVILPQFTYIDEEGRAVCRSAGPGAHLGELTFHRPWGDDDAH